MVEIYTMGGRAVEENGCCRIPPALQERPAGRPYTKKSHDRR